MNTHHLIWAVDLSKAPYSKVKAATQILGHRIPMGDPCLTTTNSNILQIISSHLQQIKIIIKTKEEGIISPLKTSMLMDLMDIITMDRISTKEVNTDIRRTKITKGTGVGKVKLSRMGNTILIIAPNKNMW